MRETEDMAIAINRDESRYLVLAVVDPSPHALDHRLVRGQLIEHAIGAEQRGPRREIVRLRSPHGHLHGRAEHSRTVVTRRHDEDAEQMSTRATRFRSARARGVGARPSGAAAHDADASARAEGRLANSLERI